MPHGNCVLDSCAVQTSSSSSPVHRLHLFASSQTPRRPEQLHCLSIATEVSRTACARGVESRRRVGRGDTGEESVHAGYASRKKPSEGKVQDLFVKSLALEDEQGGRLVIVTMDLIGVPQAIRRAVAERAEKEYKLPPAALIMNASHTHSGPSLRSSPTTEEDLKNPKIRDAHEYTQALKDKIVGVIGKSLANLQPARLTWNKARCGFAMNRRRDYTLPPTDPNANKAPNPNGPVDQEVPALRVESPEGEVRAILFGYACHNTCLGFFNYCGDYAGYAQEYLQQFRPGCTALFLMGCGADQNPYPRRSDVVPGVTDLELAQQHGRSLANAAEMAITVNPRGITGPIRAAYEEIKLAYADPKKPEHDYPVQVIQLGDDLTFITLAARWWWITASASSANSQARRRSGSRVTPTTTPATSPVCACSRKAATKPPPAGLRTWRIALPKRCMSFTSARLRCGSDTIAGKFASYFICIIVIKLPVLSQSRCPCLPMPSPSSSRIEARAAICLSTPLRQRRWLTQWALISSSRTSY